MNWSEFRTYFAVFSSYIGSLSVAFMIGFPSPTQKQLIQENILDFQTLPIFASISHFTRILGMISAPILSQFGINLNSLATVSCVIGGVGYILIILANSAAYIIVGVSLVGFNTGIIAISVINYIPEIALDSQRRVMSGGYGFFARIGLFIVYLLGIWLPFRWLAIVGMIQTFLFCLLFQFNPPSPVWYVREGLEDRAKRTLQYLHGNAIDTDAEVQKIRTETLSTKISWTESISAFKRWSVMRPLLQMLVIASLKELGGHEAMVAFSSHILDTQKAMDPKVASLFYPIFLIAGAVVSINLLNYCKMKWLLLVASVFQTISHVSMSFYYLVSENHLHCLTEYSRMCHFISYWPMVNIALFAFSFTLGWGLVYYTLLGIVFTVHKEFSIAFVGIVTDLSSYLVIMIFFYLLQNIGGFATFLIFATNYIVAIVFVYLFINI